MSALRLLQENRGSYRSVPLNEEMVAAAWEGQLFSRDLALSPDLRVQVVYRGRRNFDAGPDFLDAIIAFEDGRLLRGDVEVHLRASDWRAHGHGSDRRYDGVILHVVMWDDLGKPTRLSSGASIPVLALYPFLSVPLEALREKARQKPLWNEPCAEALAGKGPEELYRLLDRAGQARLAGKAAGFEAAIAVKGPEQALFEGVAEALGYAKNREAFRQLAECLPLAQLRGLLQGKESRAAARRAEAILLGVAGLLPSQRRRPSGTDYALGAFSELERAWKGYGGEQSLVEEQWNFFRTRPENFPTRRIAGVARLIAQSLEDSFVGYLLSPLTEANPRVVRRQLVASLIVDQRGAAGSSGCIARPALIGRGRAKVIVVNVLLPFAVAYGNATGQPALADRARWAYFTFPRLPSDTVVRLMGRQLYGNPSPSFASSACRQQGLHHIHKEYCRWRRCGDCPLIHSHS